MTRRPTRIPMGELSERELEILAVLASGRSYAEAAAALHLSSLTIKSHLHRMHRRLGLKTTTGVVAYALRRGLIAPAAEYPCEVPSAQQLLVLQHCANDRSLGEVAAEMWVAVDTVKSHMMRTTRKLRVKGRTPAVAVALSRGWIE